MKPISITRENLVRSDWWLTEIKRKAKGPNNLVFALMVLVLVIVVCFFAYVSAFSGDNGLPQIGLTKAEVDIAKLVSGLLGIGSLVGATRSLIKMYNPRFLQYPGCTRNLLADLKQSKTISEEDYKKSLDEVNLLIPCSSRDKEKECIKALELTCKALGNIFQTQTKVA